MEEEVRLTTVDNPWNPYTNYESWLAYDLQHYNTNELIAKLANYSDDMTEKESDEEMYNAMKRIVAADQSNRFYLLRKNEKLKTESEVSQKKV